MITLLGGHARRQGLRISFSVLADADFLSCLHLYCFLFTFVIFDTLDFECLLHRVLGLYPNKLEVINLFAWNSLF